MDIETQQKWDRASRSYDLLAFGNERRLGAYKRRLFSKVKGTTLMVAAGTGNDFQFFPADLHIFGIDISPGMLAKASRKAAAYRGTIELRQMDVCDLQFPNSFFDTVVTVCTFCSVPKPVAGLRELWRILKSDGRLLMFEHVRSQIGPLGVLLDLLTPLARRLGPELNRDTVSNVRKAGFRIRNEENVYLDIVKIIEAVKDPAAGGYANS